MQMTKTISPMTNKSESVLRKRRKNFQNAIRQRAQDKK